MRAIVDGVLFHRELVTLLARRELEARYGGTLIGVWWTIVTPLAYALVLAAVFAHVSRFNVGGIPFLAYVLSGVIVLNFVTNSTFAIATSVVTNRVQLRRVFVPVWVFVAATALVSLVTLSLTTVALIVVQLIAGQHLPWTILGLPVVFMLLELAVAGFGLLVGALAVVFADIDEATRVLMTLLGFATPIFYPVSIVPHAYRWVIEANPLYHFVVLFRHLVYVGSLPDATTIAVCLVTPALLIGAGAAVFTGVRRAYPTML